MSEAEGTEICFRVFGRTDVGQVREHNEDNFLVGNLSTGSRSLMEIDREQRVGARGTTLVVCDGMGGAAAGEVASQLAVDIIYEKLTEGAPPTDHDELARRLVHAVEEAGVRIFNEARADRTRRGMGTTATVAALMDSRLFVAQVGDSRAYILRKGELVQVSRDQSLVNQLIEAGQLTEEEAETFEHNNIILQALGTAESVQVDLTYVDLRRGGTLMLCSDGLSGMMRADEIREVLSAHDDPLAACKDLTDRANSAGGHDNITVIVAKFDRGLPELEDDDVLLYQKYALPDSSTEHLVKTEPISSDDIETGPVSDEAQRESRKLRVSHTMVGMSSPVSDASEHGPVSLAPPSGYSADDEPVHIPTTGLPPAAVGFMVLGAMIVVAVAGCLLLR